MRASAYPARVAVETASRELAVAATMLFRNHRPTGVAGSFSTRSYACRVGCAGNHCGTVEMASSGVLNDVDAM